MALTERAHELISEHFTDHDLSNKIAVDATCGNGHDTAFLAKMGFQTVFGFDIQEPAIVATRQRLLTRKLSNTKLILDGHENLARYLESEIDCALFNLGYMPNADKTITTIKSTSIAALQLCLDKLAKSGLLSILCYPGHPQGAIETNSIQQWLTELNDGWQVKEVLASHPGPKAPILYLVKLRR